MQINNNTNNNNNQNNITPVLCVFVCMIRTACDKRAHSVFHKPATYQLIISMSEQEIQHAYKYTLHTQTPFIHILDAVCWNTHTHTYSVFYIACYALYHKAQSTQKKQIFIYYSQKNTFSHMHFYFQQMSSFFSLPLIISSIQFVWYKWILKIVSLLLVRLFLLLFDLAPRISEKKFTNTEKKQENFEQFLGIFFIINELLWFVLKFYFLLFFVYCFYLLCAYCSHCGVNKLIESLEFFMNLKKVIVS